MPPDVYIFCAFVFALACLLMAFVRVLFFRGAGKRRDGAEDALKQAAQAAAMENGLSALSDRMERLIVLMEEAVSKQNTQFKQNIEALEKNVGHVMRAAEAVKSAAPVPPAAPEPAKAASAPQETPNSGEAAPQPPVADVKAEMVMAMHKKGVSQDDIARRLGMPQGAVALIIGLGDKNA